MIKLGDVAKSILDDFVKDPATGKMVRKSLQPAAQNPEKDASA